MGPVFFVAAFVVSIASPLDSAEPSFARPIPKITVTEGNDVSLPCVINNLGDHKVAWIRNHTLLTFHNRLTTRDTRYSITNVGNQTWWLNITDVQESDSGEYSCQINTSPMKAQTGYLEVIVPSFGRPIPNITLTEGNDVSLPCVINNIGDNSMAWIYNGTMLTVNNLKITRNSRYSIKNVGNHTWWLNITEVEESDTGLYSCQIYTLPRMTQTGYLEVNASPPDSTEPSFARPIPNITVAERNDVSLPCVINNIGDHKVTWTCNHTLLTFHNRLMTRDSRYRISKVRNQTWWLNITNVQASDSGEYSCQINTSPMKAQTVYLEVIEPSFARPIPNITVTEGNDVSLPCVINNIGGYVMAWMYNHTLLTDHNRMMTRNSRYSITNVNNQTWWLNITDVQESDRGLYSCKIYTLPRMTQAGYLEVIATSSDSAEPSFASPIPSITVAVGNDVSLSCVINNLRNHKLAWIHNDTMLTLNNRMITRNPRYSITNVGNQTWWLNITDVEESDRGEYSCQIYTRPMMTQTGYLEVIECDCGARAKNCTFEKDVKKCSCLDGYEDAGGQCRVSDFYK